MCWSVGVVITRVVTESAGRSILKMPASLVAVPFLTGGPATGVVWCSCQTAADWDLLPSTRRVTRFALALVVTMTISSGSAEANTSTPGSTEVAETIVVPNLGNRRCPVNMPIAWYSGMGVSEA